VVLLQGEFCFVLFLTFNLTIKKQDIRGLVVALMDLPSAVALKHRA
jgi:hypothetical protein